jgi:hypothetical protein
MSSMENEELHLRLATIEKKIDNMVHSVERIKKYMFWSLVGSVLFFILPILGLIIVIPLFLGNYVGSLDALAGL